MHSVSLMCNPELSITNPTGTMIFKVQWTPTQAESLSIQCTAEDIWGGQDQYSTTLINSNKGGAGGYTLFTPKERYQKYATKRFLLANLIIALGGRAAEVYLYRKNATPNVFDKYVFDKFKDLEITTGASNDLIQANKMARDYITQYGFGDNIGIFDNNMNSDLPFMGREMGMNSKGLSENSKYNIDTQISGLVEFAFNKALELIEINKCSYEEVVDLLKVERTISGLDIINIVEKHKILNKEETNKID